MKQIKKEDLNKNFIYPIYEEDSVHTSLCDRLGYDLNKVAVKTNNEITVVHTLGKCPFDKIIFVGLGTKDQMTTYALRKTLTHVFASLKEDAVLWATPIVYGNHNIDDIVRLCVETHCLAQYQEQVIGHDAKERVNLDILADQDVNDAIAKGLAYAEGINLSRKLADRPANLMTPDDLLEQAQILAKDYDLELTVLNKNDLMDMKAGGILSVNLGSDLPAYMLCLKYNNNGDAPYHAVIGKGITFDSGGYNIKGNSFGMKYDMCGAANVIGVMKVLASTHAKANVYGIIPTTENLINGSAYKPQDVITTLAGKTIEIVSTDAEGRLILCDAITYAQQLGATHLIDMATLTGACVSALGDLYTGVFSNDDEFCDEFMEVTKACDEKSWRLPIDDEYFAKLKSNSADFKNSVGKMGAGASVAANFLGAFVEDSTKWIHLDIAGTADNDGSAATGVMIRSICEYLSK